VNKYSRLSGFFAVLLLLLYSFSAIQFDFVHALVHEHEAQTLHTSQDEKDPCHRAIYHGDKTNGCHHKNHFIPGKTKCSLCDVFFSREHLATTKVILAFHVLSPKQIALTTPFCLTEHRYYDSSRAPPLAA
jgi:hypothetical protein